MRAHHATVRTACDQACERRQLVPPAVEDERGCGRVETDDEQLRERHAAGATALLSDTAEGRNPVATAGAASPRPSRATSAPGVPSTCRQRRPSGSAEVAPAVAHRRRYSAAP